MFFGMVRQSSGADDHPSANQFLFVYRLLSVSSLIRPPKAASVQTDPSKLLVEIQALLTTKPKSVLKTLEEKLKTLLTTNDHWDDDDDDDIDELLLSCITVEAANVDNVTVDDNDNHENCNDDLLISCSNEMPNCDGSEHTGNVDLAMTCDTDDCSFRQTILHYLGGYVAHKLKRYTKCLDCLKTVKGAIDNDSPHARLLLLRTRGGLVAPSHRLSSLLSLLEQYFERFQFKPTQDLYQNIINEVLIDAELPNVAIGCLAHHISLTSRCIHFYVATRIHFINREHNKKRVNRQDKHKHSKIAKLT